MVSSSQFNKSAAPQTLIKGRRIFKTANSGFAGADATVAGRVEMAGAAVIFLARNRYSDEVFKMVK